jgi:hypothetical protein
MSMAAKAHWAFAYLAAWDIGDFAEASSFHDLAARRNAVTPGRSTYSRLSCRNVGRASLYARRRQRHH